MDILSRLKINCLEVKRDTAKKRYRSHKKIYVKNCLGRPLDKLSVSYATNECSSQNYLSYGVLIDTANLVAIQLTMLFPPGIL